MSKTAYYYGLGQLHLLLTNFVHTLWILSVSFLHDFCGILHLSNDKYFALGFVRDNNKLGSQRLWRKDKIFK